ncbi:MAG: hypothetical protein KXJ49_05310 [Vulcanococcus sp.]|uniref:hypothetical protein n=1 Tax=Vulcanococcus sp. TaxID=2856995 RepID=UPI0025F707DF|nr:hypothetical protein [Vulcanococcus sp.]MBW0166895.1 hypothetical protein [Vulcanococcus sp.]
MPVDYLLHSDGAPQREYARQAAADGVITYSYSTENFKWIEPESSIRWSSATVTKNPQAADAQQANYIDTIFGFIDSITGIRFQKVEGQRGEIHLNFVPTLVNKRFKGDFTDGNAVDPVTNTEFYGGVGYFNGYGQMYSYHNQAQYGALQDIRAIQTTILETVGITAPNGDASDPAYSWDNTLMSSYDGGLGSFGATFFLTTDDQAALQAVLGRATSPSAGGAKTHIQRIKEDLMLGTEGVVDTFKLTSKGVILKKDSGTQYDDLGPIYNNYNVPYIANFNPGEGDKILIHRSLLDPKTPASKASKKLAKPFAKTKLRFKQIFGDTYTTGENVYYNDAGKILIDTNGNQPGLTPKDSPIKYFGGGIQGQLAAFVDPVGPETIPFQGDWLDFFM